MSRTIPDTYTPAEDEELSSALISALSEAKGRDISEDECILYDNIEPDALDKLFSGERDENTVKVEFATHDAIVVIWRNTQISIGIQDFENDSQ